MYVIYPWINRVLHPYDNNSHSYKTRFEGPCLL